MVPGQKGPITYKDSSPQKELHLTPSAMGEEPNLLGSTPLKPVQGAMDLLLRHMTKSKIHGSIKNKR